ncbi:hypothetical protein GGQ92_001402 [Gracilibacillus halotolerans]|uniref:Peptidase S9 prolyl oligopeptidase catalytic domain-containing protein n=1 Tax=Gracilibacillus halotolerans TaxID=74386 RepID=A0A841RMD2_9BACI|nr:alpha/beta fold hydrolase [Gracilibacillus halotolerans]MBB6512616.1 hypothetical protein [Gracilibacillus halotolerans]
MASIIINKETWLNIPILNISQQDERNNPLPTVIFLHGITSAKEQNLPIAYLLAEKGYRVILPDAMLHGEREEKISSTALKMRFFEIIKQNLDDLESIYEVLAAKHLIKGDRLGIAGTSMGGISTAAALTQFSWVKTAGILMGSPKLSEFATMSIEGMKEQAPDIEIPEQQIQTIMDDMEEIDLSQRMETLFDRPLFFWHGEQDEVVPFDHSYSFYEMAAKQYTQSEKIKYVREANRGHKVSRMAINELVKWFETHL